MAAAAGGGGGGSASGSRKPGSPRDSESEVWSRRVRELVSAEPASRLCFECGQRGVTYVDITIGSFVCTACSGALRGLNPPHRVKSISMTTFTEGEVQFLQSRGNEACRKIWLGSFDSRSSLLLDSQDPQKVKEFLQEKYEKKRWYLSPDQAKSLAAPSAQASPAEAKTGAKAPQVSEKAPAPAAQPAKKASTDLLADIGGDPFAAPPPRPSFSAFGGSVAAHPAFPSFDAFGGGPAGSTFGDHLASSQSPFQSHPITAGVAHVGPFPASPASQPGVGIPSLGGAFRMGAVPSSVFGPLSQPPTLPPSSPAAVFGGNAHLHQPLRQPSGDPAHAPVHQPLPDQRLQPRHLHGWVPRQLLQHVRFPSGPGAALLPHPGSGGSTAQWGVSLRGVSCSPRRSEAPWTPCRLLHQSFCEPDGRSTFASLRPGKAPPHQPLLLAPSSLQGGRRPSGGEG